MEIGYALSSEEHPPLDLVRHAQRAEEAGFGFALVSDHFHPWIDRQGQSPFVWSVLGAIAEATEHLRVGTGVTCPTIRIHPAIVAQAAATSAVLLPDRFVLGVGTGENLNEHVLGDRWPSATERRAMLREAVHVMRSLWEGDLWSFDGDYYTVDNARIYTLPSHDIEVMVAAGGPEAAELAGEIGDGLVATQPDPELVEAFVGAGASGQELPLPSHFEAAAAMVTEDDIGDAVVCGPDPAAHLDAIATFGEAGFDHVYIHQIGPDQEGFLAFYEGEILAEASEIAVRSSVAATA